MMLGFVLLAAVAALSFAAVNFIVVQRKDPGNELMQEIAGAIQEGADAFIWHEYKVIFSMVVFIALLLSVIVSWYTGVAFVLGAVMSGAAGLVGMKIATIANVRVSNMARVTGSLGKTLKVAFQGGSVMGLAVGGFALLGLAIVYLVFGRIMGQTDAANITVITNRIGINYIPFTMTISGYALGCSVIAMFDRVGGGIYTKAADMGADLVGKTEVHIPEDDPRNPATIADNVGDNVGDVAGLGADLLESYVGSLIAAVVLATYMFHTQSTSPEPIAPELLQRLMLFPPAFAAIGVLACILGIFTLIAKRISDKPHRELNVATWTSALLTLIGTGVFTYWYFDAVDLTGIGFQLGRMSPWLAAVAGIITGVLIGQSAEYYTSYSYGPTKELAAAAREGTALTITEGLSLGMRSVFAPVLLLAVAIITANAIAGLFGVAMAAVGMLSFVVATVSVDTYGPIADNAGGISEMSKLDPSVREITDHLDSVGNTTAAIGKGFAIGSAAFAALSLFASYLFSQAAPTDTSGFELVLNMIDTLTLAGALVGAVLPFLFSGILIRAVARAARKMVQEVRRQFSEHPGILSGTERPDYKLCIE
ncbi:MAG: sodium-translocating pyrophosphatase, partial [Spirochaeta sp.]